MWVWDLFCSYFWSPSFWLPGGLTWKDFENTDDGIYHAQTWDLLYVFPVAAALFVLRQIFERYVGAPLGIHFGLKEKSLRKPKPNPLLEDAYVRSRFPQHEEYVGLSKKTGLTIRQVERWFRIRRNCDVTCIVKKFSEASWRFSFYFIIFIYGLYVLWDKPWFGDVDLCWKDITRQHVSNDIFSYYIIEMGFYVSLMVSQFMDVKRKDFYEMMIHHLATVALMFLSWCNNFVRVGTLVLLLHDSCDPPLELGKMLNYLKSGMPCNIVFGLFVVMWIISRLTIFPFWIVQSTLFEAIKTLGFTNIYYLYNGCLIALQILHVVWFIFIVRVVGQILTAGRVKKDSRSESEESVSEDDVNTLHLANGIKTEITSS